MQQFFSLTPTTLAASLRASALAVLLPCLISSPALSQTPALSRTTPISSADLLADAAILRSAFEQLHPGLYRYNTRAQMDDRFFALNTLFAHDLTLEQTYLALSTFTAGIRCGHTYANFFNQPKSVVAALFQGQSRLPV